MKPNFAVDAVRRADLADAHALIGPLVTGLPLASFVTRVKFVTPAKAGVHLTRRVGIERWMPAFAGMRLLPRDRRLAARFSVRPHHETDQPAAGAAPAAALAAFASAAALAFASA